MIPNSRGGGRANALFCPPLRTPMVSHTVSCINCAAIPVVVIASGRYSIGKSVMWNIDIDTNRKNPH